MLPQIFRPDSPALTAWRYPGAGGYRPLPELTLACSGLSISSKKDEWVGLAGDHSDLKIALEKLYEQFRDAPVLGSLINTESSLKKESLFEIPWEEISGLLDRDLAGEEDDYKSEMGVVARGLIKAAQLLSKKYYCVTTNVPYRSSNDLTGNLRLFVRRYYKEGETDLATVFLLRIFDYLFLNGNCSIGIPQNWLTQP